MKAKELPCQSNSSKREEEEEEQIIKVHIGKEQQEAGVYIYTN